MGNVPVVTFSNQYYDWKMLFVKRLMDIAERSSVWRPLRLLRYFSAAASDRIAGTAVFRTEACGKERPLLQDL